MRKRWLVFALFLAVALGQITLLGWMIVRYEVTLREGRAFKFRTAAPGPGACWRRTRRDSLAFAA